MGDEYGNKIVYVFDIRDWDENEVEEFLAEQEDGDEDDMPLWVAVQILEMSQIGDELKDMARDVYYHYDIQQPEQVDQIANIIRKWDNR